MLWSNISPIIGEPSEDIYIYILMIASVGHTFLEASSTIAMAGAHDNQKCQLWI